MRALSEYIDELRSLDQNNIGSWPPWAYGLAVTLVSLIVMAVSAWYFVLPRRAGVQDAVQQESVLRQTFESRQAQVANLAAYRAQLATMQAEFGHLLAQLPSRTEVPSLLRDISQARSANGLNEQLFKPEPEVRKDFYAELPNDLVVTGDFHQFARFVSDVAALPRIVTLEDITIEANTAAGGRAGAGAPSDAPLRMSLTATTYRYLENGDSSAAGATAAGKTGS